MTSVTLLYKILDASPGSPLPEKLPVSELDRKDGFTHLSNAERVPKTASLYFGQYNKLWILQLKPEKLDGELRWPGELPGCAHVHNSAAYLGRDNIEAVIEVEKAAHKDWQDVPELQNLKQ